MAERREEKDILFTAFKKLKVETDWVSSGLDHLKMAESDSSNKEESVKLKSPNKSHLHRTQPYPKDRLSTGLSDLQKLDGLTLAKEACTKVNCQCNLKKRSSSCFETSSCVSYKLSDDAADAAAASDMSPSKCVLRDARLKLHHREKDQKFVLRAARLKLSSGAITGTSTQKLLTGIHSLSSNKSPTLIRQGQVFGSRTDSLDRDFKQVAKSADKSTADSDVSSDCTKYGTFRSPSRDSSGQKEVAYDLNALRESLTTSADTATCLPSQCPVHPGRCPKPCSCAHQARLDDWSEEELACYFEEFVHIPKKMSMMAEMMYT